jgi:hypothetical protein
MPNYHVLRIEELGELDFYGNLGAVAEFEDKSGLSISEIFQEGKSIKLSQMIGLIYECHVIACLRLGKNAVEFERFKAFADKSLLDLFMKLMEDITSQITDSQKKTSPKVKK